MKNVIHHDKVLWTLQILLAALYLFAGLFKVFASAASFGPPGPLPVWFLRMIGMFETLGALGLILPGLTGIRRGLTPVAAGCLIVIMIGATVVTALTVSVPAALFPLAVGMLDAVVMTGRREWLPAAAAAIERPTHARA